VSTLAGGYKLRVLIAQTLFGGADVLLLDEPTNHLDLDSIRWLEGYLTQEFRGTLLVVSHDRHFMNAIATHVADVDYQTVTVYTGDYTSFIEQKTTGKRQAEADVAQKKKKVAELKDFVARFGASASRSSQAQSRVKEIEKLEESIQTCGAPAWCGPTSSFDVEKPSGRDVLRVESLAKSFGDLRVIRDLSMNLNRGRQARGHRAERHRQVDAAQAARRRARARRGQGRLGPRHQRRLLRAGSPRGPRARFFGLRVALPLRSHGADGARALGAGQAALQRRSGAEEAPRTSPAARPRASCSPS
jgi:ATPase subunit of ABC transporter with duplicated ATPase domains